MWRLTAPIPSSQTRIGLALVMHGHEYLVESAVIHKLCDQVTVRLLERAQHGDRVRNLRVIPDTAHSAKASAVKARSQAIDQLKAIIVRSDPALRDSLTGCRTRD